MRVGLCLSGGGARGSFHIGVLRALEENGIRPEIISGTSAGALIGSLYSAGLDVSRMLDIATHTRWYHFLGPHIPDSGLIPPDYLEKLLVENLPVQQFEDLLIPFICTASNMDTGELHYFENGNLAPPIIASCAIPIVFKPVTIGNARFLDGGILMNLPCSVIRSRCDLLIASNVIPSYTLPPGIPTSYSNIMTRVLELSIINTMQSQIPLADLLIEDARINQYSRFNLRNALQLYELGYDAAISQLNKFKLSAIKDH